MFTFTRSLPSVHSKKSYKMTNIKLFLKNSKYFMSRKFQVPVCFCITTQLIEVTVVWFYNQVGLFSYPYKIGYIRPITELSLSKVEIYTPDLIRVAQNQWECKRVSCSPVDPFSHVLKKGQYFLAILPFYGTRANFCQSKKCQTWL